MNVFDDELQPIMKGPCDELNGGCEQICIPTSLMTKVCRCRFGYQPDTHHRNTCSSAPVYSNFILVSDWTHGMIYQLSLDTNTVQAVDIKKITNPSGIAYNHMRKTVIWGSSLEQQIFSVGINGSAERFLFATGDSYSTFPDRFAIDFSTGNIYYTAVGVNELVNPRSGYIAVLSVDALHKRLITNLEKPRAIVLHPSKGLMFWTDHGSNPHVGMAEMDGRSRINLITTGVTWPNGLTIDYSAGRLYWSDGHTDRIESCKLDGSNRKIIFVDSGAHLMDIAYEKSGSLYYTAWNRPYITKLPLSQPNQTLHLFEYPEFGRLDALEIYTVDSQPRNALCLLNNGNCSTFCLPTMRGRNCSCEDGVSMSEDGKMCSNVVQAKVSSTASSSSVTSNPTASGTSTATISSPSETSTFSTISITRKSTFTTTSSAISTIKSALSSNATTLYSPTSTAILSSFTNSTTLSLHTNTTTLSLHTNTTTLSLHTNTTTLSLHTNTTTSSLHTNTTTLSSPTSTTTKVLGNNTIIMPSTASITINLSTTNITSVPSATSTIMTSIPTSTIGNSLLTSTTITSLPAIIYRISSPTSISKTLLRSSTTTTSLPTSSTTSSFFSSTITSSLITNATIISLPTSTTTSPLLTNTATMSLPTSTITLYLLTDATTVSSPTRTIITSLPTSTTMSSPDIIPTTILSTIATTTSSPNRFNTSSTTRETKTTADETGIESLSFSNLITSSKPDMYTKHDTTKGNKNQTQILIATVSLSGTVVLIVVTVLVIWCIRK
ncbi:hypothetical protein CHS0354_036002, partial [Potamilus streckersoni]